MILQGEVLDQMAPSSKAFSRRMCFERADLTKMSVIAAVKQGGTGAIFALQIFMGVLREGDCSL